LPEPRSSQQTVRREIIDLLMDSEHSAREISARLGIREKEVYEHLEHIRRSVKAQKRKLVVVPARCLSCDYVFEERRRLSKPGRCPNCRATHLADPGYFIK